MKFEYAPGATPIDDDEAAELIPTHITTQKELNEWEQANITEAYKKHLGKKYSQDEILDVYFLLNLHKDMFDQTWKWAGKIRKTLKNIGVAPEGIREKLKKLLDNIKYWLDNSTFGNDEICVRFHGELVSIHLFSNGNGRHARFAADLLVESVDIPPFTWGSKDLYNKGTARTEYLDALREADKSNYKLLLKFVKT
jgi:Fic-DOC domain mobile mystery protein B